MIANQVGGKAVRDALFLSEIGIESLPLMVIASAIVTIGAVLIAGRVLNTFGPKLLVPAAFAASAVSQFVIWPLVTTFPRIAAVGLYAHLALFGAVLISWYWSMIGERLDPSTARRRIAWIAGGGTAGGLAGGALAGGLSSVAPLEAMLPVLAGLHVVCAGLAWAVARGIDHDHGLHDDQERGRSGLQILAEIPYLRNLAFLVAVTTVAATLIDWAFKMHAAETYTGEALLRFFGLFYTAVAAATFLVQTVLTRRLLAAGISRTISILPSMIALGATVALGLPAAIVMIRGAESALRSSLFRSSYELFYNPIQRQAKRATKTLVDVGFDRLGDAAGGALIQLVLLAGVAAARSIVLGISVALGLLGLVLARRLHQGYMQALETSLVDRARHLDAGGAPPSSSAQETSLDLQASASYLQTVSQLELSGSFPDLGETTSEAGGAAADSVAVPPSGPPSPGATPPALPSDPLLSKAAALRSGDVQQVDACLRALATPPRELSAFIVPLLAWDAVAPRAIRALGRVADRDAGLLLDSLLDPDEEFAIRRRIPRVLARGSSQRILDGLLQALEDRRFELRYQVGVALEHLQKRFPALVVDSEIVLRAVRREGQVDRRVWDGRRLLDDLEDSDASSFLDQRLAERSSRSLEHVFTCLSLVYARKPLQIAYRGLHASDPALRGTALEYLHQLLPPDVRSGLWQFLGEPAPESGRSSEEALGSLLKSHPSIEIDLEKARAALRESQEPAAREEREAPGEPGTD